MNRRIRTLFPLLAVAVAIGFIAFLFLRTEPPAAPLPPKSAPGDERRIADLKKIKSALDQYAAKTGALPRPDEYGEAAGLPGFWEGWWDLSAEDQDGDGLPFLDFLVEGGVLPSVPTDPVNRAAEKGNPRGGSQYVYFVVPPGYDYEGGVCEARPNRWHYLVAITKLENKATAPVAGSGCPCLWKNVPKFFHGSFDYVLCGEFDASPETAKRALARLRERAAARTIAEAQRLYGAEDARRVADIGRIQQGLKAYLAKNGTLPAPREYGESDHFPPGFWQGYWDLSSEDADRDGRPFLDFLAESGVLPAVPVDPENKGAPDGDPRGGRQYVYYVASPEEAFGGGPCSKAEKKSVYLLGITDLRSEEARPPKRFPGSGCECLWQKYPNLFQSQFDYVVCGTF